ncbi:hypothetical protein TcasGA2_TC011195 [Tribolium castaneum]|uniref:Uncharacterized protein n=1 Tax=Tribolium castaneum TaxID=7070 RepID=D6X3T9_TRICA|nr:hypothetical protein TcasGA2_TC011195 [Tribolium castaneum]
MCDLRNARFPGIRDVREGTCENLASEEEFGDKEGMSAKTDSSTAGLTLHVASEAKDVRLGQITHHIVAGKQTHAAFTT